MRCAAVRPSLYELVDRARNMGSLLALVASSPRHHGFTKRACLWSVQAAQPSLDISSTYGTKETRVSVIFCEHSNFIHGHKFNIFLASSWVQVRSLRICLVHLPARQHLQPKPCIQSITKSTTLQTLNLTHSTVSMYRPDIEDGSPNRSLTWQWPVS